jgi:L-asparaginase
MKHSIHILITGGTIDSYYDVTKDTVVPNKETVIPNFIDSLKSYDTSFEYTTICMKDSRQINDEDRKKLVKAIEQSKHTKILIIHGTYTMPDTARYIQANLKRNDQAVILTASMIPLQGFSPSDAPYNLGFSIAKLQDPEIGIFVCINSHVFLPGEITKNLSEGKFTSIYGH